MADNLPPQGPQFFPRSEQDGPTPTIKPEDLVQHQEESEQEGPEKE